MEKKNNIKDYDRWTNTGIKVTKPAKPIAKTVKKTKKKGK